MNTKAFAGCFISKGMFHRLIWMIAIIPLFFLLWSCSDNRIQRITFLAMGGIPVEIIAQGIPQAELERAGDAAQKAIEQWEDEISLYRPNSVLNQLHQSPPGTPISLTPHAWEALEKAREAHRISGGAFDINVGPLIKLWKQAEHLNRLPTPQEIQTARQFLGFNHLHFDNLHRTVTLLSLPSESTPKPEIPLEIESIGPYLDLGGIAKGLFSEWILRNTRESLSESARKHGQKLIVNCGGDMYCYSFRPSITCTIGIQNPFGEGLWGDVLVREGAVVTSGTYERFFTIQNKKYCHIIDPTTGWPIETNLVSVTIIDPSGAMADALATTVFVLGEKQGFDLINARPDTEMIVIRADGSWTATEGIKNLIQRH